MSNEKEQGSLTQKEARAEYFQSLKTEKIFAI